MGDKETRRQGVQDNTLIICLELPELLELPALGFAAWLRQELLDLIDQEDLGLALVGGLDGGAALDNRTDIELHARHVRRSLQLHTGLDWTIELIADLVGITVLVGEADGRIGDVQLLAIGGDGDLRHHRSRMVCIL